MGMKGFLNVKILFFSNKVLEEYTALVFRIYRGQLYIESIN
jgi:hypothetical protein